ncbi:hypothetical protein MEQU1_001199 [Malassezia equina]|uniref:HTH TFE/IIEalpha-type domain-containing protein n=1 Tax=Malassezia equina TaxID=1381935 RepID=A0AAF0EA10_9BASI|nr:hypothetical protein MEQU1_001199 [Malassezia equina]
MSTVAATRAPGPPAAEGAPSTAPPAKEAPPATPAQMAEIRRLVQIIGRLFYDDGHILLLDQLVSIAVIPSDVLARRVGLQARDLGSLAAKLVEDRVVCVHRIQESREGPFQRSVMRTYYFMDYKQFLDVTKWRMMAMRRHIDTKLRNGLDNKGYVCPRCRRSYSALEVAHLLDIMRNVFVCEVPGCGTELVDNEDAEDVRKSKDTLTRFNEQLHVVQQSLRSVEGIALPPMDIHAWLAKNSAAPPWQHEAPRDETALAPGAMPPPPPKAPALKVEMLGQSTTDTQQQQQQRAEEERQRAQNILPSWHLASTVSGERTGLGHAEAQHRPSEVEDVSSEAVSSNMAQGDADLDYYARYTAQLDEASSGSKRAASPEASSDTKRAKVADAPDDSEDDMEDMDDVI